MFWYNLDKNGRPDSKTRHAACPVIVGSKWGKYPKDTIHEGLYQLSRVLKDDAQRLFVDQCSCMEKALVVQFEQEKWFGSGLKALFLPILTKKITSCCSFWEEKCKESKLTSQNIMPHVRQKYLPSASNGDHSLDECCLLVFYARGAQAEHPYVDTTYLLAHMTCFYCCHG